MKKRIILILLIFTLSIGFVSASENTTETITDYSNDVELINSQNQDLLNDDVKYSDIYVNSSKEVSGDGLSPETAYKSLSYGTYTKLEDNGTIHLAEGHYEIPNERGNYIISGMGDNTVITSCWFQTATDTNDNKLITFANLTFDIPLKREVYQTIWIVPQVSFEEVIEYCSISLDGTNFRFIDCTFINSSIVSGQYLNSIDYQNPIMESTIKSFENCKFLNYSYNGTVKEYYKKIGLDSIRYTEFEAKSLITSFQYTKFIFDKCVFDNITAVCVADSRGGLMGTNGIYGEIIIQKSSFSNCNVTGIVKVQQVSDCKIEGCTYDFNATNDISGESPFYINKTDIPLNETKLTITSKDNSVVITLTDVNADKPIAGVEVGIFNNGKVFGYFDTDSNGQIVLDNLLGTYNFEFSYPGDPYAYLPTSVNKTLIFNKTKSNAVIQAPKVAAIYNVAKNLVITLKDSNGNALFGKYVTVKVGSVSKRLKTDKNGKVSLNVATLVPKAYVASISFAGDDDYNKASSTVKVVVSKAVPKLSAKAKTFKKSVKVKKYKVTLKNNLNKVLKNVKLTVKVNKRTYSAKTNSKGVATFKITKLTKRGTFKAKVSFKGSSLYKAVSKSVKIKVK